MGYSSADFARLFQDQFWENFQGYPDGPAAGDRVEAVVRRYAKADGVALDIGCGRGDLTARFLVPHFARVLALDLIPTRPLCLPPTVAYQCVPGDRDYTCYGVADQSIDFAFSFGCFCHLPNSAVQAYLGSIRRVLKPDGVAVVAFANWPRHPLRQSIPEPWRFRETPEGTWFYCDLQTARQQAVVAGFASFIDLIPDFRDTLAELRP